MRGGGQASTEYLFLLGMLLVIAIPVWYYAFSHTRDELKETQVSLVIDSLQTTINEVYLLGAFSQEVVDLYIPSAIAGFTLANKKEVVLLLNVSVLQNLQSSEVAIPVLPQVVGKLDASPGVHRVRIWMMNSSLANVTDVIFQ